jgi:four helix bundle protein
VRQPYAEEVAEEAKPRDITERAFDFALSIVRLCRALERRPGSDRVLSRQLLRSGTSIGANVEEAQAGRSRADFINSYAIALKEARETTYWLRLLAAAEQAETGLQKEAKASAQDSTTYGRLLREAGELAKIIGAIVVSARSRGGS